jgi:hypothetical protein
VGCGIDIRDYLLREAHFSDLKPFEIDTYPTIRAARESPMLFFSHWEVYTCVELCAIRLEFDNAGYPISKTPRWADPESLAALVLEEFGLCANLIIIPGDNCDHLRYYIPLWGYSPQDLRGVSMGALCMLTDLG